MKVAFVLPYGEPSDGFFPDTLLSLLCAEARWAGHEARIVRVYYHGRDRAQDEAIAGRLEAWLGAFGAELVVVDRLFDPAPLRAHLAAAPGRTACLVSRGDSYDPVDGIELLVGAAPGTTRSGATRRSPTIPELVHSFRALLAAFESEADPAAAPGVSRVVDGVVQPGRPLASPKLPLRWEPVTEHEVIAPGPPPKVIRKTLFGNAGCPYAGDPLELPHFQGVTLPEDGSVARLGCAFCPMGGDYQKRPDAEVVSELVAQALWLTERCPDVEELVLADQHALRTLAPLVRAAAEAGVRPVRWLFAARADAFVRERAKVEAAIAEAGAAGHVLEVYLSGFEAFCDAELLRYGKGVTVEDQLAAVAEMRRLAAAHPQAFAYARAKGHSLILFGPWTTPEDLQETVEHVRRHGLAELFHELGRNRLRLYADLPITHAAARDGALAESWEDGDEGAGRRKGYSIERPWRFLDRRTRIAYELAALLRERLGAETEPAQLAAVAELAQSADPGTDVRMVREEVAAGLAALEQAWAALGPERAASAPPRGAQVRAAAALFAGACNNGCASCAQRERFADDAKEAVLRRVEAARASGQPVLLAGREPTIHGSFLAAVRAARGPDGRAVGVVTNGRRFAHGPFTAAVAHAGLAAASVKLFAPEAGAADAISRDPGGFVQALDGVRDLRGLDVVVELRLPLHAANLAILERAAILARVSGAAQLRLEAPLDAIGLDRLAAAAEAVERLGRRCARDGVALEVSPLRSGARGFLALPVRAGPRS